MPVVVDRYEPPGVPRTRARVDELVVFGVESGHEQACPGPVADSKQSLFDQIYILCYFISIFMLYRKYRFK